MKRKSDPRHQKRIAQMQALFEWEFRKNAPSENIKGIVDNLKVIDKLIQTSASQRPLKEISKVDLAILRLSVFELIIIKEVPFKVVVDEAVELGKDYSGDTDSSFINGCLGKIIEMEKING